MAEAKSFDSLADVLDNRILGALAALSFTHPTPVQAAAIPLALDGKDILARARTGSGKTLAYIIPIVHRIIKAKAALAGGLTDPDLHAIRALVLVPTRELSEQVASHFRALTNGLGDDDLIKVCNIAGGDQTKGKGTGGNEKLQRMQLADRPDVVISTPSRALTHLRSEALSLSKLESLVIDEADLILSYGNSSDDIKAILTGTWELPAVYQSSLMSATLTGEVEELKGIVLRSPAILKLEEDDDELANLTQYSVRCTEQDKFLLTYVICRLKLIKGKSLIFVNDTDRSYRLKLFLEKFGIRSGVLNAELPFNSRYHAVQEFNKGVFDYLIATDESGAQGTERDDKAEVSASTSAPGTPSTSTKSKKRKRRSGDDRRESEYGVARGIDFIDVACVINFDLPTSARSYTHRVGRTARAGRSGMALSFVVPKSALAKPTEGVSSATAKQDESVWKRIDKDQKKRGADLKEYRFDMTQVEGFRYRMEDGLRSVTRASVKEARIKEIKNEVLNSETLKAHFEENPKDLAYLRHDKPLHPSRIQPHLKNVPSYLMPRIAAVNPSTDAQGSSNARNEDDIGRITFHKPNAKRGNGKFGRGRGGFRGRGSSRKSDPLKTFASKRQKTS